MRTLVALFCFFGPYLWASNKNSLEALSGDRAVAPLKDSLARKVPGDSVSAPIDTGIIDRRLLELKKMLAKERLEELRKRESELKRKEEELSSLSTPKTCVSEPAPKSVKKKRSKLKPRAKKRGFKRPSNRALTVFNANLLRPQKLATITLPSGAHAFGRVKFGEEVRASGKNEVLVELDYAFLGPNRSVVELNGCIVWLSVFANFHTQKVKGELQDLTCTMKSGQVFTVGVSGPLVGLEGGYAGASSDLIVKGPAKLAALKFLTEITQAYGAATAIVETTTQAISSDYHTEKTKNITGERSRYVGGKVVEANAKFLEYVASFFSGMEPTLAIAPGTKVHVVNRHNVEIPKEFFSSGVEKK